MSHIRMTPEAVRAHQERIGRQMAAMERDESPAGDANTVTLTLPYPISSNRYWRSFVPKSSTRAVVVLSDEARNYKRSVHAICAAAGIGEPIAGRVRLKIELYPARPQDWARRAQKNPTAWDDDVRSIDLDNALKVTLDALKDNVFADDKWVRRIEAERMEPDGEARMVVTVTRMEQQVAPQMALEV